MNHEEVRAVEAGVGLPLDEFIAVSSRAPQEVAPDIDLERGYQSSGSSFSAFS